MEFTGERVVPGKTDPDLMNEHWARYKFAEPLVRGKSVVDAGSGLGYGSAFLAETAQRVIAVDFSAKALQAGQGEYAKPNLDWVEADCGRLPIQDGSVDVVVAFEVIEHLERWEDLIAEAARVLCPHGQFIVSTPNRTYSQESRLEPNPFHVHEFEHGEFETELGKHFPHVLTFLENHSDAITFIPPNIEGVRTRMDAKERQPDAAHFFLAVCSKQPQHGSPAFVFLPSGGNVLRERERHVQVLREEVQQKQTWLDEATAELKKLNRDHEELNRIHAEAQQKAQDALDRLEQEKAEQTKWAEQLQAELDTVQADREKLIERLNETEQRVTERSEWAMRLDGELTEARDQLNHIRSTLAYRASRRLGLLRDPKP